LNKVTEHYAMDVPRLTRIVDPEEHAGKLIMSVEIAPVEQGNKVKIVTDTGEIILLNTWVKLKVETGMERAGKLAWARAVAAGEHPPVADERQVMEIVEEYAVEYDSVMVSQPDEVGRITITALLDDVAMRVTVVSPDGTVTPRLTPTDRNFEGSQQ
jgi:hypothetical protein